MQQQQQKMLPSANNVNKNKNNDKINLDIQCECFNDESDENLIKCECTSERLYRRHHTYRGSSYMSSLVLYIYMWITIFAICCSGLPPVIKIGEYQMLWDGKFAICEWV